MAFSAYELVKNLSFIRYGGTAAEEKAAQLLAEEVKKAGGEPELMPFQINASEYKSHAMKVIAPYEKELTVTPFGMCDSIPTPGKDLKFQYITAGEEMDLLGVKDLSDTIVMINQLGIDAYKRLCKLNCAAILVIMGKYYHNDAEAGIYARNLRPKQLEYGAIPTFAINAYQATELVRDEAQLIHVELEQTNGEHTSHDVLAVIEGTEKPEESIVLVGHYDSLTMGAGAWDNATGSAALMGLYNYFMENKPARTLRFVWCGAEEQGLLGSKAYIDQHEDLMDSIKFCFNFDMCGTVLGPNSIFVTGSKELETFAELFCREVGYSAKIRATVHSSDSAPFADKGVPGIGLSRGTSTSEIHTCRDDLFPIGEKALNENITFAAQMISRVANAAVLPVEKGMPEDVQKEIDKYFQRDK